MQSLKMIKIKRLKKNLIICKKFILKFNLIYSYSKFIPLLIINIKKKYSNLL